MTQFLDKAGLTTLWQKVKTEVATASGAADEEDLTKNSDNKLTLKDRGTEDGRGYVILRKTKSFSEQVTNANTIYEVRYNFDLNGETVTLPEKSVLRFNGGSLKNGIIDANGAFFEQLSNGKVFEDTLTFSSFGCNKVTPDYFGAVGDGTTDDTSAFRLALKCATTTAVPLEIPVGKIYYITDSVNYWDDEQQDVNVSIIGHHPKKLGSYTPTNMGGIKVASSTSLFSSKTIKGEITNVCIVGVRDADTYVFDTCELYISITNSCIANFGAFLVNSGLHGVSEIAFNTLLSCWYFSKVTEKLYGITDTTIHDNYINGGTECNDNACFQFASYNGSIIYNNFIDYYRTIYEPTAGSTITAGHINSCNNHYQVFRYFYRKTSNIQGF